MEGKKHIENVEQLSLAININRDKLCYIIYNNSISLSNEPAITGFIPINASTTEDWCKALENAVYDNPFLLDDYNRCTISLLSQHFTLMPQEVADAGLATQVLEASFSSVEGDILTSIIKGTETVIACDVPQGVVGFLRRTFTSPTLLHHLSALCRYCCDAYAEENGCLHVLVENNLAHLVVTRQGRLLLANTVQYRSHDDLVYFVLNTWQSCEMSNSSDKILTSGDNELRQQLAQSLRQWVKYAMPEVLPAQALKLSRDAVNIPFHLILLALYENN